MFRMNAGSSIGRWHRHHHPSFGRVKRQNGRKHQLLLISCSFIYFRLTHPNKLSINLKYIYIYISRRSSMPDASPCTIFAQTICSRNNCQRDLRVRTAHTHNRNKNDSVGDNFNVMADTDRAWARRTGLDYHCRHGWKAVLVIRLSSASASCRSPIMAFPPKIRIHKDTTNAYAAV